MATPKLRFKGFSDNWKSIQLKQISKRITRKNKELTSELPLTISAQYGLVDQKEFFNKVVASSNLTNYILIKKGEFAYNKSYSKGYSFGAIKRLNRYKYGALSTLYIVFKLSDDVSSKFFEQYYNSNHWNKEVYKISSEGARNHGLLNISPSDFFDSKLYIPSTKEQIKIGGLLSLIDKEIEIQQNRLDKISSMKEGYLQKLFLGEDEKKPKLRFKGFNDDWKENKVDELFKVTRGNVLSKNKISEVPDDFKKYPVYSSQTKNNGLLGYYNEYLYKDAITWTTDGANAGTVKFRKGKFYSTNVNGVLLSNDGYSNESVAYALNRVAYKYVSHVGNPKLMNNTMSDIRLKLPSVNEQDKLSILLNSIDKQINLQKNKLEQLNSIKKGYLQQMFE